MRLSFSIALLALVGCGEPTMLPPFGDSAMADACREQLARWDEAHPLPEAETSVVLDPALISSEPAAAADGDRATVYRGTSPEDIVLILSEPVDIRGIRHYPAAEDAISHYEAYLGDDGGCDALEGEAVVPLGPFYEDLALTPRVAASVRISVLESHDGSSAYGVADFALLVGAGFENEPPATAQVDVPWTWSATARIPGTGTIEYATTSAPGGMEIDVAGTLTWLPHISQVGDHVVNVVARRGEALIERRFVVSVAP